MSAGRFSRREAARDGLYNQIIGHVRACEWQGERLDELKLALAVNKPLGMVQPALEELRRAQLVRRHRSGSVTLDVGAAWMGESCW